MPARLPHDKFERHALVRQRRRRQAQSIALGARRSRRDARGLGRGGRTFRRGGDSLARLGREGAPGVAAAQRTRPTTAVPASEHRSAQREHEESASGAHGGQRATRPARAIRCGRRVRRTRRAKRTATRSEPAVFASENKGVRSVRPSQMGESTARSDNDEARRTEGDERKHDCTSCSADHRFRFGAPPPAVDEDTESERLERLRSSADISGAIIGAAAAGVGVGASRTVR